MTKDNVDLICDVAELATLFEDTSSLEEFLDRVVGLVAEHMNASACSVFLYDESEAHLVLRATRGLNAAAVGSLKMKPGEGITGAALKELRPIREGYARKSTYFKPVPGIWEERYSAMLAVPILRGATQVGVLVVQHETPDYFDERDAKALLAIAVQLAATLENIRLLLELRRVQRTQSAEPQPVTPPHLIKGIPGAEGIALGEALIIGRRTDTILFSDLEDTGQQTAADLAKAAATTERQLTELQRRIETDQIDLAASFIFGAHLLMLKDDGFLGRIKQLVDQGINPAQAVIATVNKYVEVFAATPDPVFQEKAQDVKDLGYRLIRNLRGADEEEVDYTGLIIVAADLLPSDIVRFAAQGAEGIVHLGGSATAHVAILAGSVGLPMIAVSDERVLGFTDGMPIILDAGQGCIYPEPSEQRWAGYQGRIKVSPASSAAYPGLLADTCTRDGTHVNIFATINLLRELKTACRFKAQGVGLYRTEFPFIMRNSFPSEAEQVQIYRVVTEAMRGKVVTFRTLDIGGDKFLDYYSHSDEANPFLGLRAIRFTLRNQDIFEQQLRALLRSREDGDLRVMFPLVSSVDDFLQARQVVERVRERLTEEGIAHCNSIEIGAMIELPSAVEIVDELAQVADFLSIGTNDLIQYMLAVDRSNTLVADLYVPHHPAVLRALKRIAVAAERHRIEVSVCGEMCSDVRLLPFLLGIGIRTISINPEFIPQVQACIAQVDAREAQALANELLSIGLISDVETRLRRVN